MLAISSEYTQYPLDELGNSISRQKRTHTHTYSLECYSSFDAQILTKLLSWVNIVSPDITKSPKRKIHYQTERSTNMIIAFVCWLYKMRLHCINSNETESISIEISTFWTDTVQRVHITCVYTHWTFSASFVPYNRYTPRQTGIETKNTATTK